MKRLSCLCPPQTAASMQDEDVTSLNSGVYDRMSLTCHGSHAICAKVFCQSPVFPRDHLSK